MVSMVRKNPRRRSLGQNGNTFEEEETERHGSRCEKSIDNVGCMQNRTLITNIP